MNFKHYGILIVIVALMGTGMYTLKKEKGAYMERNNELSAELLELQIDNKKTREQIEYLGSPQNLLKELKSQFNYRNEGEKLIIVVPASTSTPTSTIHSQ